MAVGAAGNLLLFHRMGVEALDLFDADDTFMLRLVGKHRRPCHIADGIKAGYIGAAMAVDDDRTLLGLNPQRLEAEILDIAGDADGRDDTIHRDIGLRGPLLDRGGDAVPALLQSTDLCANPDLEALLLELLLGDPGDLGIFHRHDLVDDFDHRHIDTHGIVERRELDTDGAGTHDQQRLRHGGRHHGLEIGPHQLAVGLKARQHPGPGAGRDDDMLGCVGAGAERAFGLGRLRLHRRLGGLRDDDFAGLAELRLAPDDSAPCSS